MEKFYFPQEIWDMIILFSIEHKTDGKTFKTVIELNKYHYEKYKTKKLKYCNQLWTLIMRYPHKPWNWDGISQNPNITPKIIENNLDKPWVWPCVSRNPNITMDFMNKHSDKQWSSYAFSKLNITMDFILEHDLPNKSKRWSWLFISQNPNITMKDIEKHPDKPWSRMFLSENPNITMEFIKRQSLRGENITGMWDWDAISRNPNITMDIIENNPDEPWEWECVSENPNLTMKFIEKNPDKPWDWGDIFENSNITLEFIERQQFYKIINMSHKFWMWGFISKNPNITIEDIERQGFSLLHTRRLESVNPNVTIDIIKNNPDDPWDWNSLSRNKFNV
jgi:hypothetical protein